MKPDTLAWFAPFLRLLEDYPVARFNLEQLERLKVTQEYETEFILTWADRLKHGGPLSATDPSLYQREVARRGGSLVYQEDASWLFQKDAPVDTAA